MKSPGWLSCILMLIALGISGQFGLSGTAAAQAPDSTLWPEPVDALVLLDESEFRVESYTRAGLRVHRKVLVLNENGREYGKIVVVEGDLYDCKSIHGRVLDAAGNEVYRLKPEDITRSSLSDGSTLASGETAQHFYLSWNAFPYTIEYDYELEYSTLFLWPDWYPQKDIPVLRSVYTLVLDTPVEYKTHSIGLEVEPQVLESGRKIRWELTGIAPRIKEYRMPPEHNIQKALLFAPLVFTLGEYTGSCASWDDFARWYAALAKDRYQLPPEAIAQVQQLIRPEDSPREKVRKIYAFLQNYTRYVAIELGVGGWQPYPASWVYEKKYGDCKDLATFLGGMLRVAGVPAHPVLLLTRNRGLTLPEFPSNQFNHAILCVPLEGDTLWLDGTVDYVPAGELPYTDEGCNVLVVTENGGKMVRTPVSRAEDNAWVSRVEARLTSLGVFSFSGTVRITGEQAYWCRNNILARTGKERKQWIQGLVDFPNAAFSTYRLINLEEHVEQPLEITFEGRITNFARITGRRMFVSPAIMNRYPPSAVPEEDDDRQFPVFYRYPFSNVDSVEIRLPIGYRLEAAPEPVELETDFGYFRTGYDLKGRQLTYLRVLEIRRREIPPEQFGEYREFIRKVCKADNASFVFKK